MQTNSAQVTMDSKELELLERYEAQFGETPPVAFLDPQTSKKMILDALRNNRPFDEKDLESEPDIALIRRRPPARSMRRLMGAQPRLRLRTTPSAPGSAA
jgi:hypothetical protein